MLTAHAHRAFPYWRPLIALIAALAFAPTAAPAVTRLAPATQTGSQCSVLTTSFSFDGLLNPTGSVTVECPRGLPFTLALGSGADCSGNARHLRDAAGQRIAYNFYTDAARTKIWGDGLAACLGRSAGVSGVGTGASQTFVIYGRSEHRTGLVPGMYSDNVLTTVNY